MQWENTFPKFYETVLFRNLAELWYNRSAKNCKQKFENIYKYHKRTKDVRSGRPNGEAYSFFEQLQALDCPHNLVPTLPPPSPVSLNQTWPLLPTFFFVYLSTRSLTQTRERVPPPSLKYDLCHRSSVATTRYLLNPTSYMRSASKSSTMATPTSFNLKSHTLITLVEPHYLLFWAPIWRAKCER